MTLKYLLQKEWLQLFRNPFLPRLILIFPLMVMCVIPWVMNMEVKNIRIDMVDLDRSPLSQRLVQRIVASNYFAFNAQRSSYAEAIADVESSDADLIVTIPANYSRQLVQAQLSKGTIAPPQILLSANAANATKGSIGSAYLSQIATSHLAEAAGLELSDLRINVQVLNLYNKTLNYKVFMIPALMAMLLMMLCGFLPALNIVSEKEAGTIEQINVTPVGKGTFILAKLIPYFVIGMVVISICFLLSWLIYGITSQGSYLLVYLLSVLLAFVFSALGLIISNYSDTMQQAVFVMWFAIVCLMLLSGMYTPTSSMPDWAQYIVMCNPMHYFIDGIRTIFVRGGTLSSISTELSALSAMAAGLSLLAVMSYRKNH